MFGEYKRMPWGVNDRTNQKPLCALGNSEPPDSSRLSVAWIL